MSTRAAFAWRVPAVFALLVAALLVLVSPAAAHQHRHGAEADSSAAVSSPARSPSTGAADRLRAARRGPAASPRYAMPPMRKAVVEHLHNKIVHFPLALALAAALLLVLGRQRPELDLAGQWLVRLAALGGAAAYVTGRLQKEAFKGEPKEWLVGLHERWGTATAIVLVVWALVTLWKPTRRHAWLWGLVAAVLVLITGFYGGLASHGE